jgi:hypothetical protein
METLPAVGCAALLRFFKFILGLRISPTLCRTPNSHSTKFCSCNPPCPSISLFNSGIVMKYYLYVTKAIFLHFLLNSVDNSLLSARIMDAAN